MVLSQEGAGSVLPLWAASEDPHVQSPRKGGEHMQPQACVVQVVGLGSGQAEDEHGAAG